MKKITLLFALIPFFLFGQKKEGSVHYDFTVQFKFEGMNMSEFKDMLPKEQKSEMVLHFKNGETVFENIKKEDDDNRGFAAESGGMELEIKMPVADNKIYCNLKKKTKTERKEFLGKYFLINDKLTKYGWKLSGEVKKIQGYVCQKAVYDDKKNEQKVVAWFTSKIAVSSGPMGYGQLPGLILELDMNDGERVYTANKISLGKINSDLIVKPTKGKKVNQQQYEKIVDAKIKQMGGTKGKGGTRMIMITEDEN